MLSGVFGYGWIRPDNFTRVNVALFCQETTDQQEEYMQQLDWTLHNKHACGMDWGTLEDETAAIKAGLIYLGRMLKYTQDAEFVKDCMLNLEAATSWFLLET